MSYAFFGLLRVNAHKHTARRSALTQLKLFSAAGARTDRAVIGPEAPVLRDVAFSIVSEAQNIFEGKEDSDHDGESFILPRTGIIAD